MFLSPCVCVCVSVCNQDNSNSNEWSFMNLAVNDHHQNIYLELDFEGHLVERRPPPEP